MRITRNGQRCKVQCCPEALPWNGFEKHNLLREFISNWVVATSPKLISTAAASGEFFRGIGPDLGEGRVVVGNAGELAGRRAEVHRHHDFVDELGRVRANH